MLMTLQEQIKDDLKNAMKNKKQDVVDLLRVVIGEFSREGKILNNNQVIKVLKKMSANAQEMGNTREIEILDEYLPKMLDENQIKAIVSEILIKNMYSGMGDMGKVMGKLKSRPDAASIDGKMSSTIVKEMLSQ